LHNVNLTALQRGRASVLRVDVRVRDAVDGRLYLDKRGKLTNLKTQLQTDKANERTFEESRHCRRRPLIGECFV
jgi:hypothetical protein